jgi:hypothetical protein
MEGFYIGIGFVIGFILAVLQTPGYIAHRSKMGGLTEYGGKYYKVIEVDGPKE